MKQIYRELLKIQLKDHEGLRLKPYRCTEDKLTIGIGRNLDDKGITETEAFHLLDNDISYFENQCINEFKWFEKLDPVRKNVIVEMAFNMGIGNLKKFKKFIKAVIAKKWIEAYSHMLDSKWARQVKNRSHVLADEMRTGNYKYENI